MKYRPGKEQDSMINIEILTPLVKEGLGADWIVHPTTTLAQAEANIIVCTLAVQNTSSSRIFRASMLINTDLHVRSQVKILVSDLRGMIERGTPGPRSA